MKPKLSSLCLLLSVSTFSILPIPAEEAVKAASKTEEEIKNERSHACYQAVEANILVHLNPEVSFADRFSRVARPIPEKYYSAVITSQDVEGVIGFEIVFTDRRIMTTTSPKVVIATGKYNSKNSELFLMDDQTGEPVAAAEHRLVKNTKLSDAERLFGAKVIRP